MKTQKLLLTLLAFMAFFTVRSQTADVQIIHNSADVSADTVDVWLDNTLLLDNFAFRTATPFTSVPAGVPIDIRIQPKNSTDTINPLAKFTFTLTPNEQYIVMATGLVSPTGYSNFEPFDLHVYPMARQVSGGPSETDVLVYHGSTDAPTVDVVEIGQGAGTIVDDISYGNYAGYLDLPTADYSLQIRNQSSTAAVAQYGAPLASLNAGGAAAVVVASGFLDPDNNNGGAPFGLFAVLPTGGELIPLPSQNISTAEVQVIHNSGDAAAATVDVWLNDQLLIDNFNYRTASPYVNLPAGAEFTISIAGPNSTDTANAVAQFPFTPSTDMKYVVVADGIVSSSGYNPNQPFGLEVYDMGRTEASTSGNTDVLVHHGATDVTTVDVVEVTTGTTVANDLAYTDFQGYLELPTNDYRLQVRTQGGVFGALEYEAPLQSLGLEDSALVVLASGFINPGNNSNGPAFGLYAALPSGGQLVQLPSASLSTANVQIIHNSADNAASTVDIWLNDQTRFNDFPFRVASSFVEVGAGAPISISVSGPNSNDTTGALARFSITPEAGRNYVVVADGIVSSSGYSPNQPFDLKIYDMGRLQASQSGYTDVLVHHGSTDAPTVDVTEVGVVGGNIVDNASYGDFAGYLELPTNDYRIQVRNESSTAVVAEYSAPLSTLGLQDSALVVLASGFLDSTQNSNGASFGLFVALPQGGQLIPLPMEERSVAMAQIIHNSADAAASEVDVYLADQRIADNFAFRTSTPYVEIPTGAPIDVVIQPGNSTDTSNALARFTYDLNAGSNYVIVASGIVSGSGYDPAIPFNLDVYDMGRMEASASGNTDVLVYHGSTDAPIVDVSETGVGAGTIVDNLAYGEFAGYLELGTEDYELTVQDSAGNTDLFTYQAPLSTLGLEDSALVVVASGFVDPSNNSGGPGFGLWVALPAGGALVQLPLVTGITTQQLDLGLNLYPVPANEQMCVEFSLE